MPGAELEVLVAEFEPHTGFTGEFTHEGVDIVLALQGRVIITISDVDYPLEAGEAAVWSGAYRHRIRNDQLLQPGSRPAHRPATSLRRTSLRGRHAAL